MQSFKVNKFGSTPAPASTRSLVKTDGLIGGESGYARTEGSAAVSQALGKGGLWLGESRVGRNKPPPPAGSDVAAPPQPNSSDTPR